MDMRRLMLALLLLLLIILLTACGAPGKSRPVANTPLLAVGGRLAADTVLSGRVLLLSDLLVPAGRTLTIEAGTTVLVRLSESTRIDPEYLSPATELLVRGTLKVLGTDGEPVRFLPERLPVAETVAWAGILFDGSSDSHIAFAQIEGADTGIYCIASSVRIENSRLVRCRYGLIAQAGSAVQLLDSTVEEGEGGIFCWQRSHALLEGNIVRNNQEEGIYIDAGSQPFLSGNVIEANGIGIVAAVPRQELAAANRVHGNGRNYLQLPGIEP